MTPARTPPTVRPKRTSGTFRLEGTFRRRDGRRRLRGRGIALCCESGPDLVLTDVPAGFASCVLGWLLQERLVHARSGPDETRQDAALD